MHAFGVREICPSPRQLWICTQVCWCPWWLDRVCPMPSHLKTERTWRESQQLQVLHLCSHRCIHLTCTYVYIYYYIILYYITLYYIILYYIILYYTLCCVFHNPFWPGVHPMQCTVHSHTHCYFFCRSNVTFIAMFDSGSYIVLYCIVLYCIILYYITLYYIILYYIIFMPCM